MALSNKTKYLKFISSLEELLIDTGFTPLYLDILNEEIANTELLIPIIGEFSAGKSSLLNDFLGESVLPVGLTPETELATELRYGKESYIVAELVEGGSEKFAIDDFETIKHRAEDFSHLKAYINNEHLKNIEPLVLVDMPGFGANIANHSKAINFYIPRGVFFIVLSSVEEGGLTQSMIRRLSELDNLERDFTVIVSKSNLRSTSEVAEIVDYISEQLALNFDNNQKVVSIGNLQTKELSETINRINSQTILDNLFLPQLKNSIHEIIDNITISKNVKNNNQDLNEHTIRELARSIHNIENKRESVISSLNSEYSNSVVNNCIDYVGKLLEQSQEELGSYLAKNNTDLLNSTILEIIREGLSYKLKSELQAVSNKVVMEFENELKSLNASMSDFGMNTHWADEITERMKDALEKTGGAVSNFNKYMSDKLTSENKDSKESKFIDHSKAIFRTVSTVVAVTTSVVAPIAEIVIIFLPEIIEFFTKRSREAKLKESVRTNLIPKVKQVLRQKLPDVIEEQVSKMINDIAQSFENELDEKRALIVKLESERNEKLSDINQEVLQLEQLNQEVLQLAEVSFHK